MEKLPKSTRQLYRGVPWKIVMACRIGSRRSNFGHWLSSLIVFFLKSHVQYVTGFFHSGLNGSHGLHTKEEGK